MDEVNRHLGNLASMKGWTITCDSKTAKKLVSHSTVFCMGELRDIRAKSMGCGIYQVRTQSQREQN
jgi:hypothetical protein